ncbi:MAG: T9SS type A sorting domain-containing protein, partial [Ignavibacteriales bacterium]
VLLRKRLDITGVTKTKPELTGYAMQQNYPNPFNPSTVITFEIPVDSFVELNVYDLLGREVTTLVKGERPAGKYSVSFDGGDMASGIYIYRLKAGEYTINRKMTLIR